jgi:hypothetical protein
MNLRLTKVFQRVPEGFIAFVEELPGANAQGETLDEAKSNLEEALILILDANRALRGANRRAGSNSRSRFSLGGMKRKALIRHLENLRILSRREETHGVRKSHRPHLVDRTATQRNQ